MRFALAFVVLAACTGSHAGEIAWPKPHAATSSADDGGESIAPRPSVQIATAIEIADEAPPPPAPKETPLIPPGTPEPPTSIAPEAGSDEVVLQTEDTVIEINDEEPKP